MELEALVFMFDKISWVAAAVKFHSRSYTVLVFRVEAMAPTRISGS